MSYPHTLIPYPAPRRFSLAVLLSAVRLLYTPSLWGATGPSSGQRLGPFHSRRGGVMKSRLRLSSIVSLGLLGMFLSLPLSAGPVILGGDDLTDHGSGDGTTNFLGWLYIERAVGNILNTPGNITRPGNDGSIAALGSAAVVGCPPACTAGNAGGAIGSAAAALGRTVTYYEGAAAINQFFTDLAAGTVNPAMLWIAGTGAPNDLDAAEGAALTANAASIAAFGGSGGGLMAHGSGVDAYGWLSALLPGLVETNTCGSNVTLTAAGQAAFPGLTNADVDAGPCHSTFSGNLGGLQVLATEIGGLNVIIGGGAGTTIGGTIGPIPTLNQWGLLLLGVALAYLGATRLRRGGANPVN